MRNILKFMFTFLFLLLVNLSLNSVGYPSYYPSPEISFSSEAFISICSDDDFDLFSFPGDGSFSNPFIIEGYNFNNSLQGGIYLTNISKNVIIRNCSLDNLDYGIFLSQIDISKISVRDVLFSQCPVGISITETVGVEVLNNSFVFSDSYSILISKGHSNIIRNNTIEKSGDYGIHITLGSSENLIFHNDFFDNALENDLANSQAYDDGRENHWSNEELNDGNYWSDLGSNEIYYIDGIAGSTDNQPHPGPVVRTVSYAGGGTPFPFSTLVIVLVGLVGLVYRTKKKKS
ncbi:MAG: NosD domain-containing protein [Candidatus Heimdallarchaeaceae archaeon]